MTKGFALDYQVKHESVVSGFSELIVKVDSDIRYPEEVCMDFNFFDEFKPAGFELIFLQFSWLLRRAEAFRRSCWLFV